MERIIFRGGVGLTIAPLAITANLGIDLFKQLSATQQWQRVKDLFWVIQNANRPAESRYVKTTIPLIEMSEWLNEILIHVDQTTS
jgi:hypothetical protein